MAKLGELPPPNAQQMARMTSGMSAGAKAAFEARTQRGKILADRAAARRTKGSKAKAKAGAGDA